jgi:Dictyostelium (slime mold) repeat
MLTRFRLPLRIAALASLLLLPGRGEALHEETPGAVPVTRGVPHGHPAGRAWGNFLAFASRQDLTGTGNTTPQIFVFNLAYFDCAQGTTKSCDPSQTPGCQNTPCPPVGTPFLVQATSGRGAPDNPSIGTLPSAAPYDHWLAFDADGSFGGLTGPAAGRRQIFLLNLRTGELRQVTAGTDGDSVRPTVSSLAGVVAFESTASLGGLSNPGGVRQVWLYERATGIVRRLSQRTTAQGVAVPGAGPSSTPTVNEGGTRIAFQSRAQVLGDGHDTGRWQIFWAEYDKKNHTATLRQLTHGNGPSERPWLAETQPMLVFDSAATDLPGGSGDPGRRIVRAALDVPSLPVFTELTAPALFGDCSHPAIDPGAQRVPFVCNGDPLGNHTTGQRAFVLDTVAQTLFQLTGAGDVEGPLAANIGRWFVSLATSSDLAGAGECGHQIYVINYNAAGIAGVGGWAAATAPGQLPPDAILPSATNLIGLRTLDLTPGGSSRIRVTTAAGIADGDLTAAGSLGLVIGAPNGFTGEASIQVPRDRIVLPPIPVPGVGALCLEAVGNGEGVIDCDGGRAGTSVVIAQDHDSGESDPVCLLGCREDAPCQGTLPGPHRTLCPVCQSGACSSGVYEGLPCTGDAACQANLPCIGGTVATCNGPVRPSFLGTFERGGMRLALPLALRLSLGPGPDGVFCNANDTWSPVRDVPVDLWLTTGVAAGVIQNHDAIPGDTLETTAVGAPFDCARLRAGDVAGGRLVGVAPLLDLPNVPKGRDALVSLTLAGQPRSAAGCGASCGSDSDCDDGNSCNGAETCGPSHLCVPGAPFVCDDGNPCNGAETCDPATGACLPGPPCDDGDPCNGVESCTPQSGCVPGTPILCSDGNACNGLETCDPLTATCHPGAPPQCDDGNACTTDSCSPSQGCLNVPNTLPCDDADLCTVGDACSAGTCTGTPVACGDGDPCNGEETCNPASGLCRAGTPPSCDDGNPCTADGCTPGVGCAHAATGGPCDDGNACTTGDHCAAAVCAGTLAVLCDDGDICDGIETCNPATGLCTPGPAPDCDDGNPCTDGLCDAVAGCGQIANTAPCDDGNACTVGDVCAAGGCAPGAPRACDDGEPCNGVETCDPASGCLAGVPLDCADGNPCSDDTCTPGVGCRHELVSAACDDGDACTDDACDATAGCVHVRVPGFVVCRLDALADAIRRAPRGALGSRVRRHDLRRRVSLARRHARAALGGGPRAAKRWRRVDREVAGIVKTLRKALAHDRMDATAVRPMLALASDVEAEVRGLRE